LYDDRSKTERNEVVRGQHNADALLVHTVMTAMEAAELGVLSGRDRPLRLRIA